jgi:hypothetical protein
VELDVLLFKNGQRIDVDQPEKIRASRRLKSASRAVRRREDR